MRSSWCFRTLEALSAPCGYNADGHFQTGSERSAALRRQLRRVWYVLLILSIVELVTYGLTGYVANGYRKVAWDRFNENAQKLYDVDKQVPYAEMINRCARDAGINPQVVASIIQAESSFQRRAVSPAGAYGLMQIMPDTWRQVNKELKVCAGRHAGECSSECYYNADFNIYIGTNYLSQLLKKYQGNMVLALAAYNAGPGAVDHYGGIPPYAETIKYTENVILNCYNLENKNRYYSAVSRAVQWDKVHKWIGWCLIITAALVVLIVWRLFKDQSSWYWR